LIRIFYTTFKKRLPEDTYNYYLSLLPSEMQIKISKFYRWQDGQASLLGKILLRKGLKDLGFDDDLTKIKYTEYGRPFLEGLGDFNISHSGNCLVCAISTNEKVGIDIEEIRLISVESFKGQFLAEEWAAVMISNDIVRSFFELWTAKESVAKADGRGLTIPLKKIFLENGQSRIDGSLWHYKNIPLFDHCIVHIASSNEVSEFQVKYINIK
jgi:4'-phosphopantetheinyl transferase